MESTSHFSPTTHDIVDPDTGPQYLKMEDLLEHSSPSSPATFDNTTAQNQTSPPPVIVRSNPAKKRKSWGQQLPEPTTTLPPRKRAKTDDEKEQRRIERIKRNRAAAHNSRERKRQETETLAVLLARANAELDAYRRLHGPLPSSVVLPEVTLCTDPETPTPSLVESRGSIDVTASPASPADDIYDTDISIKREPSELTLPTSLALTAFEILNPKPTPLPSLDATQHSAAMLCDLQCPSSRRTVSARTTPSSNNPSSTSQASWWATLILYLLTLQFQTSCKQLLLAIWTIFPSKMERMIRASTTRLVAQRSRSTTLSTMTPLLLRSTRALAQRNAATGLVTRRGASALMRRSSLADVPRASSTAVARRRCVDDGEIEGQNGKRDGEGDDTGGVRR